GADLAIVGRSKTRIRIASARIRAAAETTHSRWTVRARASHMAARLGYVLYWAGSATAALLIGLPVLGILYNWMAELPRPPDYFALGFFIGCGLLVWIIARALRYVLSGT